MPAHVYMRVGRYSHAVEANVRAVAADEDYITQCRAQGIYPAAYYPHNIHFLNAALSMEGRSKEALESARKVAARHDHQAMQAPGFGFAHLLKAVPMLTLVRFGRWNEILSEPEPPADQIFVRAMHHFGRGFALSASGNKEEAAQELTLLRKLAADPSLQELKIFDLNSLSSLAGIATAMLEGELAQRAGRHADSAAAFRRAVELEDSLLYSEPPDWMLPPRQYLAAALVAAGRLPEAERVYREDLKRHRLNGWSLFGLEQTLRKQGKTQAADNAKQDFVKAWARADVPLAASRF
jgi:tetratricopeptide (TPR) repeat protein